MLNELQIDFDNWPIRFKICYLQTQINFCEKKINWEKIGTSKEKKVAIRVKFAIFPEITQCISIDIFNVFAAFLLCIQSFGKIRIP